LVILAPFRAGRNKKSPRESSPRDIYKLDSVILNFKRRTSGKVCDCFQKSMTFLKYFITLATLVKVTFIKPC